MNENERGLGRRQKPPTTIRVCLRCDKAFQSFGIHNRVCIPCQRLNDSAARPARCECLGRLQSVDSMERQFKAANQGTGVE